MHVNRFYLFKSAEPNEKAESIFDITGVSVRSVQSDFHFEVPAAPTPAKDDLCQYSWGASQSRFQRTIELFFSASIDKMIESRSRS